MVQQTIAVQDFTFKTDSSFLFFIFLSGGHSGLETLKYLLFSPHRLQKNWACHHPSYDTENQCPASWNPVTFTVFTVPMKLLFSS